MTDQNFQEAKMPCNWIKNPGSLNWQTYKTDCGRETTCYPYKLGGAVVCPYCNRIIKVVKSEAISRRGICPNKIN